MDSDVSARPVRRVRAKLSDLAEELGLESSEANGYLNLETGEVILITEEIQNELDAIHDTLPQELWSASESERRAAFLEAVEAAHGDNWMAEALEVADRVDQGLDETFVALPEADTQADYQDMAAFVDSVSIPRFQDRLDRAIRGRGAFRRFRDELRDEPAEEQRWYAFKNERLQERIRRWLVDENIELIEE